MNISFRPWCSGWEAYVTDTEGCETSAIGKTQELAAARLEAYLVICQRDGYDGSMAFCGATHEETLRGAREPEFARQLIDKWLGEDKDNIGDE